MSKKSSSADKTPEPMDASIREAKTGTSATNAKRPCYAIKTLVAEVHALFPETIYAVDDYDGRNVGLTVTFDLSALDAEEATDLSTLLAMFESTDPRVQHVLVASKEQDVLVSFWPNARTQDSREPFGLDDAWTVLADDEVDEGFLTAYVGNDHLEGSL